MHQLFARALIPDTVLYRTEGISDTTGKRLAAELERRGEINPEVTPTHRTLISPNDAVIIHRALRP